MENTPPEPNIPQLVNLLKELITKKPDISKKMARNLEENLVLLERKDLPNKDPYLNVFFFFIFKGKIKYDSFVKKVLYQLRKTQLYYSFPHMQRLEATSTKYFCELYQIPPSSIRYTDKEEGKQIGAIANITDSKGNLTKFFIKSQRRGRRREEYGDVIPKPVDTRELFVYKVLEYLSVCPEVHFFAYDEKDFYVAVKDAIFDEKTNKKRFVCTYLDLANHLKKKNVNFYNFKADDELLLPSVLINELTFSYLISLLLVLSDTFTSFNNILYYGDDIDSLKGFLIIDFYATPRIYEYDCSIFEAFMKGSGVDERTNYHFTKYILELRDYEKKLSTIKDIFNPDLFIEAVESAYNEVKKYPFIEMEVLDKEKEEANRKCHEFWDEYLAHINNT